MLSSYRISYVKVLLLSLHVWITACNSLLLSWTGQKAVWTLFSLYDEGCCLHTILYPSDKHLLVHDSLRSPPRLCPSSPVPSRKLTFSIMRTATRGLLTTRQVRNCVLAPKTHPACGLLIIVHLITAATSFQTPASQPAISHVWAGSRADLEWNPTKKTHPASGYEKMGNMKQYVLLSCETACHRKPWIQRDLELAE